MMEFEDIWAEFEWVVGELNSGMAFFEGYMPSVRIPDIEPCLLEIAKPNSVSCDCEPCWNNESDIPDRERDYTIPECVALFRNEKLASLDFGYERDYGSIKSNQKLMFSPHNSEADLTIICFAGWLLSSGNPKEAIELAVAEMREIKKLLKSDALYIGPDGLDLSVRNYLRID